MPVNPRFQNLKKIYQPERAWNTFMLSKTFWNNDQLMCQYDTEQEKSFTDVYLYLIDSLAKFNAEMPKTNEDFISVSKTSAMIHEETWPGHTRTRQAYRWTQKQLT